MVWPPIQALLTVNIALLALLLGSVLETGLKFSVVHLTHGSGFLVKAKADYIGKTGNDLTFSKGDQVRLFNKVDEHWWLGAVGDQKGYIPIQYVEAPDK